MSTYPIKPNKITHAIFDVDGTMFDNEVLYQRSFVEGVGPALGMPFGKEDYLPMCGLNDEGLRKLWQDYFHRPAEEWEKAAAISYGWLLNEIRTNGIFVKPGLKELLAYLKEEEIPCIIASGSDRAMLMEELKASGLDKYFPEERVLDGGKVVNGKPAPDLFLMAMETMGAKDPSTCLVFEDSANGIRAARNGGFPCMVVPDLVDSYTGNEDCAFKRLNTLLDAIPVIREINHKNTEENK